MHDMRARLLLPTNLCSTNETSANGSIHEPSYTLHCDVTGFNGGCVVSVELAICEHLQCTCSACHLTFAAGQSLQHYARPLAVLYNSKHAICIHFTGQFAPSPPGSGDVPGGFYWSGGYWGYCPPPAPPVPNLPPPPPPGVTSSFIKSPQQGQSFQTGPNGLANVLLDATGSIAAPNRRIVSVFGVFQLGWLVQL